MNSLATLLLETGLLQFGRFTENDHVRPYQLQLGLLPSYPDVLGHITELAIPLVGEVNHLLSTAEALPLGVSLSLRTQIPLVYARGTDASTVYELAGAYDIGHPALLLGNTLAPPLVSLAQKAKVVGLRTQTILVIVDEGLFKPADIPTQTLLDLPAVLDDLVADGRLPGRQADVVRTWISANRHPG